jgi:hypothetical protein
MMGIIVPETCWANHRFNKNHCVASSRFLFSPQIIGDARTLIKFIVCIILTLRLLQSQRLTNSDKCKVRESDSINLIFLWDLTGNKGATSTLSRPMLCSWVRTGSLHSWTLQTISVTTLHHEVRICLLRQILSHKNLPNVAVGLSEILRRGLSISGS